MNMDICVWICMWQPPTTWPVGRGAGARGVVWWDPGVTFGGKSGLLIGMGLWFGPARRRASIFGKLGGSYAEFRWNSGQIRARHIIILQAKMYFKNFQFSKIRT